MAGGGYLAIIGNKISFNFLVFIFSDLPLKTFTAVSIALCILCLFRVDTNIILTSVNGSISFLIIFSYCFVEFVLFSIKSHLLAISTMPFLFLSHNQNIFLT